MRSWVERLCLAVSVLVAGSLWTMQPALAAGTGEFEEIANFGANPGALKMFRYVPPDMPDNAPMVFYLHGCQQCVQCMDIGQASVRNMTGWEEIADELKIYVVFPEQQRANNDMRCFNWAGEYGVPTNLFRGEGENQSFIEMVDRMTSDFSIDESRVFITGFSGGGAQTALMLATWPDVFAGGAIFAGVPFYCTTVFAEVSGCLSPGRGRNPDEWGNLVREAYPEFNGPYPRVAIWQGSMDMTVAIMNSTELMEQWTNAHGIDMDADVEDQPPGRVRRQYQDGAGRTLVEVNEVTGRGHAYFNDPANNCGAPGGSFFESAGFCAARETAEFFGLMGGGVVDPVDEFPPNVELLTPIEGARLQGQVTIEATATDLESGIASVRFAIDGRDQTTLDEPPYTFAWNTEAETDGPHTIEATATDDAGNSAEASRSVVVANLVADVEPPEIAFAAPGHGDTVSGRVQILAPATDDFSVAKVEFFVDGTKIDEKTAPPYETSWDTTTANEGAHTLGARAYDTSDNEGDAPEITITVKQPEDSVAPEVEFLVPTDGGVVNGTVTVTVRATSPTEVDSVMVFVDGGHDPLSTDYHAPYEFYWATTSETLGPHTLTARAASGPAMTELTISVEVLDPGVEIDAGPDIGMGSADGGISSVSTPDGEIDPTELQPGQPTRVHAGKDYWGCSVSGPAPSGHPSGWWAVLAATLVLGLGRGRVRRPLLVIAVAGLVITTFGCEGKDIIYYQYPETGVPMNPSNEDPHAQQQVDSSMGLSSQDSGIVPEDPCEVDPTACIETAAQLHAFFDGKTYLMVGDNIPSHPLGFDERLQNGATTQCLSKIQLQMSGVQWTVTTQSGTLRDAPNQGDIGDCDHDAPGPHYEFTSTSVTFENLAPGVSCVDLHLSYSGFRQEGRATLTEGGEILLIDLFFADAAPDIWCADAEVGNPPTEFKGQPFSGDVTQVYVLVDPDDPNHDERL